MVDPDGKVGGNMAAKPVNRDDPDYVAKLEDALLAVHQNRSEDSKLLQEISQRISTLEIREAGRHPDSNPGSATPWGSTGGGVGRGAPTPSRAAGPRPTTPGVGRGVLAAASRFFHPGTFNPGTHEGLGLASTSGIYGQPSSAMGGLPVMQNVQNPTSTSPSPADVISAPLTSALVQLSNAIDPTSVAKSKGMKLRPEYYVQHVDQGVQIKSLDHNKMSYRELVSGMGKVMLYLLHSGGDVSSYIQHFNFIAEQAHKNNFTDQAFVCYERAVTDKVIKSDGLVTFVAGDTLAVASNFHAGNLLVNKRAYKPSAHRGRKSYGKSQNYSDKDSMPEVFPEDICYGYNYRNCSGACSKSHICRLCKGKHKATTCGKDDKSDKKQ